MAGFPPQFPNSVGGSEGSITADTDIDIVNTALIQLGQSPISAFGQNSGSGIILQASYNRSRDDLLRRQPWNFARQWVSLALLSQAPLNLDILPTGDDGPGLLTFTGAYQLPNDCLRVFRFSPRDAHWRIIGRNIYTDAIPQVNTAPLLGLQPPDNNGSANQPTGGFIGAPMPIGVEYIRLITNPVQWDANFRMCFVFKLMKELAFGITGLMQAYTLAKNEFDDAMSTAAVTNGIENWPDQFWNSDLNTVRYGYIGVSLQGY
jgi:hypothetical protein